MMHDIDLTQLLLAKQEARPGKIGRYNASGLWGIVNGYVKVEDFFKPQPIDMLSAKRMWNGTWKHAQVQELLVGMYQMELKKEYPYSESGVEFTLVGKCDGINDEHILEIKTSDTVMSEAKPWAKYQAKIYCSMFERPFAVVMQPVWKGDKLILKRLAEVKRDEVFFATEMVKLREFHIALQDYVASRHT